MSSNKLNSPSISPEEDQPISQIDQQEVQGSELAESVQLQSGNESLKVSTVLSTNCLEHPDEELQFFCYPRNKLLCGECLITGKYAGLETSNLKKAVERLKSRFNAVVPETLNKFEATSTALKLIADQEEEIETTITNYEDLVKARFNELRQKLDADEQEILGNLAFIKNQRLQKTQDVGKTLKNYKQELEVAAKINEQEVKTFTNLTACDYYLKKEFAVKDLLTYETDVKVNQIQQALHDCQGHDEAATAKFEQQCNKISDLLEGLTQYKISDFAEPEEAPVQSRKSASPLERKEILANPSSVFVNTENLLKKSNNVNLVRSLSPNRITTQQKSSYLNHLIGEIIGDSEPVPTETTSELFEKHATKVLEIRKKTPHESKSPHKEEKKDARAALILEMRRGAQEKRTRPISPSNDFSNLKESYKEFLLNNSTVGNGSKSVLKSFIMGASPRAQRASNVSEMYSTSNLLETSLIQRKSPRAAEAGSKNQLDTSCASCKAGQELYAEKTNAYSSKNLLRGNDILSVLGGKSEFSKNRAGEKHENPDVKLKRRLDHLSNALFN